jgi:hypothetical protein
MIGIRWRALVPCVLGLVACHPPSGPADLPRGVAVSDWMLVAQADYIVRGRVDCAPIDVENAKPEPVTVGLSVLELIRGDAPPGGALHVQHVPGGGDCHEDGLDRHALARLCRAPVVAFIGSSAEDSGELHFLQSARAVQPDSPVLVRWAREEIAQQESLAASVERSLAIAEQPEEARVVALIERLRDASSWEARETATYPLPLAELEVLGERAVPAIVKHLDDRRPLGGGGIDFRPQGVEGSRHYGPKAVVDALAALLDQIVGESFAQIHNGGREAARAKEVRGWRIWLARSGEVPGAPGSLPPAAPGDRLRRR